MNLVGNKYVIGKRYFGMFKCSCGNIVEKSFYDVINGKIKSCGCIKTNFKHGMFNHKLYPVWNGMMNRCNNNNHKSYLDYGGCGISVCERWKDIYLFINDMYPSYQKGLTLDRIDVNGNYELSNCRWATKSTQSINQKLLQKNNISGYRGVYFNKTNRKFIANIQINGSKKYLGSFLSSIDAAKSYNSYVMSNNLGYPLNIID